MHLSLSLTNICWGFLLLRWWNGLNLKKTQEKQAKTKYKKKRICLRAFESYWGNQDWGIKDSGKTTTARRDDILQISFPGRICQFLVWCQKLQIKQMTLISRQRIIRSSASPLWPEILKNQLWDCQDSKNLKIQVLRKKRGAKK